MTSVRAAALYAQISSDQEGSGLGVARQLEDCRRLAASLGWPVVRAAALYARISSDQEGSGLGVARQLEDCRRLAASLGWPVGEQAHRLIRRPDFPPPQARLRSGSVWLTGDVQRWAANHADRRPGRPSRQN